MLIITPRDNHLCCMCLRNSPSGPLPTSFISCLLHLQTLVFRLLPQFRHRPLHLGSHTALMVISRCIISRMCLDMSISLSSKGKWSLSSKSIDASSLSSSSAVPAKLLKFSSPKMNPKFMTSGSSPGSSVNSSAKFENTLSVAGSPHL